MITVTIENPSVRNKIRFEVESRFGTVNLSLNSKHLVLPVESFLILAACAEKDTDATLKKLNKELKNRKIGEIEKGNIKNRVLKTVSDIGSFLGSITTVYTAGAAIITAVSSLISG